MQVGLGIEKSFWKFVLFDHGRFDDLLHFDGLVASVGGNAFDGLDDIVTFDYFAEDCVAHIQPRSLGSSDEELATIGAWTGVRHCKDAGFVESKIGGALVVEVLAPNGFAAAASARRIAALNHEFWYNAVENDAVVVTVLNVSGEVFTSFRSEFRIELELDGSLVRFEFYTGFAHRRSFWSYRKFVARRKGDRREGSDGETEGCGDGEIE